MKKMQTLIFVLVALMTGVAYAADTGKIAVAVEEKTAAAQVSGVAGHSPCFLIFDRDGKLLEAVDNPYQADRRGAGSSVASFLAQKGVTLVVAGEFGGKMSQALKTKGIGYLEFHGNAEAALKKALEEREKR